MPTAGVHVNNDGKGSVMVYADDDAFVCPNCMTNIPAEEDGCNQPILITGIELLLDYNFLYP